MRYDFAAAGEFTLFGVTAPGGSEVFHLQGRLGPRGWPATTTVALAFGVPGVYGYQVSGHNYSSSQTQLCQPIFYSCTEEPKPLDSKISIFKLLCLFSLIVCT